MSVWLNHYVHIRSRVPVKTDEGMVKGRMYIWRVYRSKSGLGRGQSCLVLTVDTWSLFSSPDSAFRGRRVDQLPYLLRLCNLHSLSLCHAFTIIHLLLKGENIAVIYISKYESEVVCWEEIWITKNRFTLGMKQVVWCRRRSRKSYLSGAAIPVWMWNENDPLANPPSGIFGWDTLVHIRCGSNERRYAGNSSGESY